MRKPTKQMIREAKKSREFAEKMALWEWAGNNCERRENAVATPECLAYMKRQGEKAYNDRLVLLSKRSNK